MPAVRYGDQSLGLPWVFDIMYSPERDNGDPGGDVGRSHLEIAASTDLVNWSRPSRGDIVTPGAPGSWDYGFELGGTTLINVDGQTRFYYGSFAGEHGCGTAGATGCLTPTGNSRIGMVSWPQDRFEALHGAGSVPTRPLAPAASHLQGHCA